MSISLVIVLLLVLGAEFVNGLSDAPNAIATVVSTRVLSPLRAVAMAAVLNILGVLFTGTAVATTIGKGIIEPEAIGLHTIGAAMITIILWTMVAWRFGIPTSETHELLAGLAGAGLATQHVEPRLEVELRRADEGEVLDPEAPQHRADGRPVACAAHLSRRDERSKPGSQASYTPSRYELPKLWR